MEAIDFWYSIGSTYTYLTVMRLSDYAKNSGVHFNWRPFDVRSIMIEQKNIPFKDKPVKSAYMWRDIERRATMYGLTASLPAPYPLEELALANQIALLGQQEGWVREYTQEAYRLWFEDGHLAGSEPNISKSLRRIGQDPTRVHEKAQSSEIAEALAVETLNARDMGVFGSPTFVVNEEVFWGDDRLDDAVSWCKHGQLMDNGGLR
jgi:2-hydroxychromene-2-carboxylate isomerase